MTGSFRSMYHILKPQIRDTFDLIVLKNEMRDLVNNIISCIEDVEHAHNVNELTNALHELQAVIYKAENMKYSDNKFIQIGDELTWEQEMWNTLLDEFEDSLTDLRGEE